MSIPIRRELAAAALSLTIACGSAQAFSEPPPTSLSAALQDARLAGEGTLRWFGLKIYEARLWISRRGFDPDLFANESFVLELRYARSVPGSTIAQASGEEIERLQPVDPERRQRWLQAMQRIFPDVVEGDRIAGLNRPGRGVRFFLNDQPVGDIDDPTFAQAFFAIWLDPNTAKPDLRARLISDARGPKAKP
jgi:hypothetical protein